MPHADETFYKLSVNWTDDPKVSTLARFGPVDGLLAAHLFSQMIGYSRRLLTDGEGPGHEIGRLMYPLDAGHAARLAGYLADPGAYGPLCDVQYEPHADGNADGNADRIARWRVLNYAKWNDTREEVGARTATAREAALRRWRKPAGSNGPDADRNAGSNADRNAEQEKEQEKTSPARVPARRAREVSQGSTGSGWSPSGVLDRPPARRPPAPRDAAAVLAEQYRPGGPATDEQRAARAAEARKGLANRPARLGDDDPARSADPTGRGLTGEALARAQLDQIAADRAAEQAVTRAATAALGDQDAEPGPLGPLDPPWPDEPGDPESDPGRADADEPGRGDQTDAEPGADQYPF